MATIVQAESEEHMRQVRELFKEYMEWLRADIEDVADLDEIPALAGYREEIAELPGKYAPPDGRLLLAYDGAEAAGCVASYRYGEGVCEMKRLWVRPSFQGKQIGRMLVESLIEETRNAGYSLMFLSTIDELRAALSLYRSLGFVETAPFQDWPEDALAEEIFMKLDLAR